LNPFTPHTLHVSAPGKLMLLGEHAVVHGRPCLVTAVDSRLHLSITLNDPVGNRFSISAPDVGVEHVEGMVADAFAGGFALAPGTRFIESALAVFHQWFPREGSIHIETRSDFSSQLGLGSSSATVACTLFALGKLFGLRLEPLQLFWLGLQAISQVQKLGSGFDLAAAIYGGTLFFSNPSPKEREIIPLNVPDLPLVVAYSGIKADTPTYVGRVAERMANWPAVVARIFDAMERLVVMGRPALENAEWSTFGQLMDIQHGLLHGLGVDTPETARLVFAARQAGAYGAKLSGAGGGDCVIVLTANDSRAEVEAALKAAGGQIVQVAPNAPGVRLED